MLKVFQGVNAKIILIGLLVLVILIPMQMIVELIDERQWRKNEAIEDVTSKWGQKQTITGPIITIPYQVVTVTDDKEFYSIQYKHFLPDVLTINGVMKSEIRQRGIYDVVLYNSKLTLEGEFPQQFEDAEGNLQLEKAFVQLGISDLTGIQSKISSFFAGENIEIEPGLINTDVISTGVHTDNIKLNQDKKNRFQFELNLNGSKMLFFAPVGKQTKVYLESDWPHPSFTGEFLPRERTITDSGFDANWTVLNINRNYPQVWTGSQTNIQSSSFGVSLYIAADLYKKSTRAVKYALLFVVFTFAAFFCTELIKGNQVHPFQYLLVGLAICIFYVLLVSISEHTNFDWAYLISSVATVLLIGLYTKSVFSQMRMAIIIMGLLALLYGYLYALMQLEDLALLVGSVGLFVGLAAVMFITRKIDWYGLGDNASAAENKNSS